LEWADHPPQVFSDAGMTAGANANVVMDSRWVGLFLVSTNFEVTRLESDHFSRCAGRRLSILPISSRSYRSQP